MANNHTDDAPLLITAAQVAQMLGLTTQRVFELSRLKVLPSVRLGRTVRFHRDVLHQFLAAGGSTGGFAGQPTAVIAATVEGHAGRSSDHPYQAAHPRGRRTKEA